jgi:hypothetical protein
VLPTIPRPELPAHDQVDPHHQQQARPACPGIGEVDEVGGGIQGGGLHDPQRPPRECQEHHGRHDAGWAAGIGAEVELETSGEDEQAAHDAITALVNDKFGEGQ